MCYASALEKTMVSYLAAGLKNNSPWVRTFKIALDNKPILKLTGIEEYSYSFYKLFTDD